MPDEFEQFRDIFDQSFSVDGLRQIAKVSLALLQDPAPSQPAAILFVATVSQWIADSWDDRPITLEVAARVEEKIKPHLKRLLAIQKNEPPDQVKTLLDAAALAFRDSIYSGLDSDLTH